MPGTSRRDFVRAAVAVSAAPAMARASGSTRGAWEPRVAENVGGLDEATLTWLAQLGHRWVVLQGTDSVDRGNKGYWSLEDLREAQARCRQFGLELASLMIPLGWLMAPMLGAPDRDGSIGNIVRSLQAGGEAGVPVFERRWSPDFKWGAEVGYFDQPGRGGAIYKAFDWNRVKDAPPFPEIGVIPREALWERLLYFARPVAEAAEAAGVKLSLHPKDPPVKVMRGVERLFTDTAAMERFLDAVPSPANGFTFCQGTVTEMGVDVIDAIHRIGGRGRIHHVHFRAVRGKVPRYTEVFIDEGDVDMLEAMRAYKAVGYSGAIVSDHTPRLPDDLPGGRIGRSFSHGYIRGLIQAVNADG
jgi:mannonate dehydratase